MQSTLLKKNCQNTAHISADMELRGALTSISVLFLTEI